MKITMYELLGMVKDGKAPKKIKTGNIIYELDDEKMIWADEIYHEANKNYIWLNFKHINSLNDEVEILDDEDEEKKIPENNFNYIYSCEDEHIMANFENIKTTLKDIIDYLKSKGE